MCVPLGVVTPREEQRYALAVDVSVPRRLRIRVEEATEGVRRRILAHRHMQRQRAARCLLARAARLRCSAAWRTIAMPRRWSLSARRAEAAARLHLANDRRVCRATATSTIR